jgi:hypothetical protein
MADRDLQFGRVLESGSSSKRSLLIVLPFVLVLVLILVAGAVAISRMSSLSSQVQIAQQQAQDAQKAADEHDQKLPDARAEAGILGSAGQGAAVLAAAVPDSGESGIAILHPETNAINLYAYNLAPPPEGQAYRVIAKDASGQEKELASLAPDDRGAAFVLARNVPEGVSHVEVALVPKTPGAGEAPAARGEQPHGEAGAAGATRKTVLAGDLPKAGEAGVIAQAPKQQAKPTAQGRHGRR